MTKWGFSMQWPDMVSPLVTRFLGDIWPNVSMTRSLSTCQPNSKPDLWVEGYMWCLLFLYTFETLETDISLHIAIFLHIFVWECLAEIVGKVTWYGKWAPLPGKAFHWNALKHIFEVHFILYPPNFFQHSQCFRDWDPSKIYISLSFLSKCDTFRWLYLSSYWSFCDIFFAW